LYVVAHPELPLFYASNLEGQSISVFDASGEYAFGNPERSTFAVPGHPNTLALDAERGILFARLRERAIALLDARTLRPLRGTWESSTLPCGEGRDMALAGNGQRLFAPQSLGSHDGLVVYDVQTLAPLHGSYEGSVLPTGPVPFAIAAHPAREILYVASFGRNAIEYRDARTGRYLNETPEASSFTVPSGVTHSPASYGAQAPELHQRDVIAHGDEDGADGQGGADLVRRAVEQLVLEDRKHRAVHDGPGVHVPPTLREFPAVARGLALRADRTWIVPESATIAAALEAQLAALRGLVERRVVERRLRQRESADRHRVAQAHHALLRITPPVGSVLAPATSTSSQSGT
jgi:hypothetical protein